MGVELEWKYAASPEILAMVESEQPGPWHQIAMATRYFDAADGALSERRWTLRLRQENGRAVACLKTPAPGGARGEWECRCETMIDAVEPLIALGAPEELRTLTAGGLRELCGAAFTRRAVTVHLDGSEAEVALDQGVLTGGGREMPLSELEVEHKSGDPAVSLAFAQSLASRHNLLPEEKSKFARALELSRNS